MEAQSDRASTFRDSAEVSPAARERYSEADEVGTPLAVASYLDLADAYLLGKCLDEADAIYRLVIRKYPGTAYEGLRERALLGVDDVRAARRAANGRLC
jgi:hypothetical protein